MKKLLLALSLLPLGAHAATDDELRRCRATTDPVQRLACYDAIVPSAAVAAPALAPAAAAAPTVAQQEAQFGLETRRKPDDETPAAVRAVSSQIPGRFEGWVAGSRFTLANGQVWQVADGSSASYRLNDPKVTVRRGAFGAYYLDIDGANNSPRVKRVR